MSDFLDRLKEVDGSRIKFLESVEDKQCPNCPHPLKIHCSRNLDTKPNGCCPGYCFDDAECDCPGYIIIQK